MTSRLLGHPYVEALAVARECGPAPTSVPLGTNYWAMLHKVHSMRPLGVESKILSTPELFAPSWQGVGALLGLLGTSARARGVSLADQMVVRASGSDWQIGG